jgi:RNA polymerase sigma-70 factor (ECF subfamily)
LTDEQLVSEYQETNAERCFEVLMDRHVRKVRGMVYAMVLNDHDADDLTQEVFLRAARRIGGFGVKSKFSTWLHRIAMNTVYDFLRRRKRNRVDHRDEVPDQGCNRPTPDAVLTGNEATDDIHRAMETLPPLLRSAISLIAIHGLSPGEAARVEKCLPATMYWRVHEARRRLRKDLQEVLAS